MAADAAQPGVGRDSPAALARTLGRAALTAFYAHHRRAARPARPWAVPRWLRRFALAGRMPLTNYLMQTAARALFIFYGWGLG